MTLLIAALAVAALIVVLAFVFVLALCRAAALADEFSEHVISHVRRLDSSVRPLDRDDWGFRWHD